MSYCETCICLQGRGQFDESVEEAITLGCLPCEGEVRAMVRNGKFWACHCGEEEKRICQGAVSYAKKIGVEIPAQANVGQTFNDTEEEFNYTEFK